MFVGILELEKASFGELWLIAVRIATSSNRPVKDVKMGGYKTTLNLWGNAGLQIASSRPGD